MFLFALGSAFGWTFFDFSRRRLGESLPAIPAVVCIMLFQALICLPFGDLGTLATRDVRWFSLAGGSVIANVIANTLFIMAVQRAAFTLVVPLLSLTPAFAAAMGWMIFGEALGLRQILAIAVVVSAALWLGWHGEGRKPKPGERSAMVMMVCTAFLWAATPFFDRACTEGGAVPLTVYVGTQCLGVALVLLAVSVTSRKLRYQFVGLSLKLKSAWPWVLMAAVAASIGLYFQIEGIRSVSHLGLFEAVKRSMTLLMSLAIGRFILQEQLTRPKILAASVMALGIFLLA